MSEPAKQPGASEGSNPSYPGSADRLPVGSEPSAADNLDSTVVVNPRDGDTLVSAVPAHRAHAGSPESPPAMLMALRGRFELLEPIGAGSMGQVLLARDRALGRKVAYKQLHAELAGEPNIIERLLAEAQITAQLDHPNIVPLYSLECDDPHRPGYVMNLVHGETLASLIATARSTLDSGQPLPPALQRDSLLDHFLKVCDAMSFAHAKGVIHRDLKPANMMVGQFNQVYVMDWGIARVLAESEPVSTREEERVECLRMSASKDTMATEWGTLIGTPRYMSPEQARGEIDRLDPRSDLYSLGLVLFELICLRPAFCADFGRVLERVRNGQRERIIAPSSQLPIPRELRAIVEKATAPEPAQRYASIHAMAEDLRHFRRGEPVSVVRNNLLQRTLRWIGHHRQLALNLFLVSLLIGFTATAGLWYRHARELRAIETRQTLKAHYADVAVAQAQRIVQHFLFVQGLLEGLSVGAEVALEHGHSDLGRYYTNEDFASRDTAPPDLAPTPHYADRPVSTEAPVVLAPHGDSEIRKLLPLIPQFQRLFLVAHGEQQQQRATAQRVRALLARRDLTVEGVGIGLADGALLYYPGYGGFPSDFDSTRRPWYTQAIPGEGRKKCGKPYRGALTRALFWSCSTAMYSRAGELVGVAMIDLPLGEGVAKLLLTTDDVPLARGLLLNKQGEILVEAWPDTSTTAPISHETLAVYPNQELVEAIAAGHSGLVETDIAGQPLWVIHMFLPELQWSYVAEIHAPAAGWP